MKKVVLAILRRLTLPWELQSQHGEDTAEEKVYIEEYRVFEVVASQTG